jgi:hypothetical protein
MSISVEIEAVIGNFVANGCFAAVIFCGNPEPPWSLRDSLPNTECFFHRHVILAGFFFTGYDIFLSQKFSTVTLFIS